MLGELKREVDMYMNSYMKEETKGKDKGGLFAASCAEVAEMESEVMVLRKEERVRDHAVVELASQRERASRQAAFKVTIQTSPSRNPEPCANKTFAPHPRNARSRRPMTCTWAHKSNSDGGAE